MSKRIVTAAEEFLLADISVVPVNKNKIPPKDYLWKEFQTKRMDIERSHTDFASSWGVAALGGEVSGGLEFIDFDSHNKDIETIFNQFITDPTAAHLITQYNCYLEKSMNGGYHLAYLYESDSYTGNLKLATWDGGESMIETRGEGGYCITYPTPGYTIIQGAVYNLGKMKREEREYLIRLAQKFTQVAPTSSDGEFATGNSAKTDPVSYFNWHHSDHAKDLLEQAGWKWLRRDEKTNLEYWRRPGKDDDSHSATWGKKHNSLYVFSSSAKPFTNDCYYTPFQILVLLQFKGDYRGAFEWVLTKYFTEDVPYIRVGTDYFKVIHKGDRFNVQRTELKAWNIETIKLDHGKSFLNKIPHFDDFTIRPDNFNYQPVINNCYNLYRHFSHKPSQGKWPWTEILMKHIFGEQYHLGIRYMQVLYLYPDHLMPILVLVSRERETGKTTFVNWLGMIFGDNIVNISPEDLVNGFNAPYAASNIIAVEETLIEKAHTVEKLKAHATAKFITVNQKFVSQYRLPFFGKFILTSNNEDKFARIDQEEIRFFIRKVPLPTVKRGEIEDDIIKEIPAFLHYLTTLPPVDFNVDRTGFTPDELNNDSLVNVKQESKSENCKELAMFFEDIFLNEASALNEFYVDSKSIKDRFFSKDNRAGVDWIRKILQREMNLIPTQKPVYFRPFGLNDAKTGRAYLIERSFFTDHPAVIKDGTPF